MIFICLILKNSGAILKVVKTNIQTIFTFYNSTNGKILASGVAMVIILIIIKRIWNRIASIRQYQRRQIAISKLTPSADRNEYNIEKDDYRRGSPKESYYRKTFFLHLLETFNNSCARCRSKENGMDIDHFIFSKNEGGCFMMKHRDGYFVNNAIPLCQTCNRSKSDKSFKLFFSDSELLNILKRNVLMTRRLNGKSTFDMEDKLRLKKRV